MNVLQKSVMFLATGCMVGYVPIIPGTFGTLPGLLLCFFLSRLPVSIAIIIILLFIPFSILIADNAARIVGKEDPGCIVIDEIAGMAVTLAGLPFSLESAVAGFFIFRFLDIVKPFPARLLDRKIPGGVGIVLDDITAGIYGNILLRLIFYFIGN